MNKIKITSQIYQKAAKPILFRMKPDFVHENMIKFGGVIQRSGYIKRQFNKTYGQKYDSLRNTVAGIDFNSPFGISAGFDKNAKLWPLVSNLGFGFMTCGSVTRHPHAGNKKPWFTRLPQDKSLIVNAGLPNEGYDIIKNRILNHQKKSGLIPLNISIATFIPDEKTTIQEVIDNIIYMICDIQLNNLSKIVEINISCPNIANREVFAEKENLQRLFDAIQNCDEINIPIFVKMPFRDEVDDFVNIARWLDEFDKVSGLTINNLRKNRKTYDFKSDMQNVPMTGGVSGLPTQEFSDQCIEAVYCEFGDRFTIIGAGGVFFAEDAYRKIRLGASLVVGVTGLIYQGPQLAAEINLGLENLLKRDGYKNISEVIGVDVKK